MSGKVAALVSIGGGMLVLVVCVAIVVYFVYARKSGAKKTSKTPAKTGTCQPKSKECAYTQRMLIKGKWKCPPGYEENWCSWSDGQELGKLQCRACGTSNPMVHYQIANPNCPPGFIPCNDPKFNFGDLKRKPDGEFYYEPGWGVDVPEYKWDTYGYDPAG